MMKINHFFRTSFFIICFLSVTTTSFGQALGRYEVWVSSGYSNFTDDFFISSPEGTYEGKWSPGFGVRYNGAKRRFFRPTFGLSVTKVGQKNIRKNIPGNPGNFQKVTSYLFFSIPVQLVLEHKGWRIGPELALETPFLINVGRRDFNQSCNLGRNNGYRGGVPVHINYGIGLSAFIGKTFELKRYSKSFFIEAHIKAFNGLSPNINNDSYELKYGHPYYFGINIGTGF